VAGAESFRFTIPTRGGEIRVVRDGQQCDVQVWGVYPGRAIMRGGVVVDLADLDLVIHGLKRAAWLRDRDGFPQPTKAA
jgi:hypothetical protein